jgi:hypothetical protein
LKCVVNITSRHGKVLPISKNYKQIRRIALEKCRYRKLTVTKTVIKYPTEMFGERSQTMKPIKFIHVDPVMLVAQKLLDDRVAGCYIFNYLLQIYVNTFKQRKNRVNKV